MTNNIVHIIKANGEKELFDNRKLVFSLEKAGASKEIIAQIIEKVEKELKDGMTTAEIYRNAFSLLNEKESKTATQYSLRKAVLALGPSGFPFENFVGMILKNMDFDIKLRQNIRGLCVLHEVDLIAFNDKKHIIGEIKFHNRQGMKSDLKVVLYTKERFDDIEQGEFYRKIKHNVVKEKWLVTNTKFTTKAIAYSECSGLKLISWDYPKKGNLYQLISETGLYPLTSLKTLSQNDKKMFLDKNVVLCRELYQGGEMLFKTVGISTEKISKVLDEIKNLIY